MSANTRPNCICGFPRDKCPGCGDACHACMFARIVELEGERDRLEGNDRVRNITVRRLTDERDTALREVAAERDLREEAMGWVRELQWADRGSDDYSCCSECGEPKRPNRRDFSEAGKHGKWCELGIFLSRLDAETKAAPPTFVSLPEGSVKP